MLVAIKARALRRLHSVEWLGPLLVRLTIGVVFVASGWGKVHHLGAVTRFFDSLGIPAPGVQAAFVASIELVGGILLLVGLGTRIAALLLIGVMAVALWTAKLPELHGIVDLAGTVELAYLVAFVWIVVAGPGRASLDHLLVRAPKASTA
jgi:putative oxidoreductase